MSKTREHEDCLRELAQGLLQFQFMEEGLRIYLERAYRLVRHKMLGGLTVRLSETGLNGKTMKQLLAEFKKFNGNDGLIQEISQLIGTRNDLAHVAFFQMYERRHLGEDLLGHRGKALEVTKKAIKCTDQLIQEIRILDKECQKEGLLPLSSPEQPALPESDQEHG